eukprot:TRINITY_DN654_c1_g1_i1.p1 TRINITY_DN654_c1_g1~~TRINITY_DN654_c1_g1_i1.p1  ORF type:complete len:933 (-),score=207.98 TRINITY_DN654_c1_g1_i1:1024-3822(-)
MGNAPEKGGGGGGGGQLSAQCVMGRRGVFLHGRGISMVGTANDKVPKKLIKAAAKLGARENSTLVGVNLMRFSENLLISLPDELGATRLANTLTDVDVSYNRLGPDFPRPLLSLQALRALSLVGNEIVTVPDEVVQLRTCAVLRLGLNRLEEVPCAVFGMPSLLSMYLNNNAIRRWGSFAEGDGSYVQAPLNALSLEFNELTQLPDDVSSLLDLTMLRLNNNKLSSLPAALCKLTDLKSLIVCHNELTSVPEELHSLTCIQALDLSFNPIRNLPDAFLTPTGVPDCPEVAPIADLPTTSAAVVSDDGHADLDVDVDPAASPDVILLRGDALAALGEINLCNTKLHRLPDEFFSRVPNLHTLHCTQNKLKRLPPSFGPQSTPRLAVLSLGSNSIKHLPECLTQLTQLNSLELSCNNLTHLPDFSKMTSLRNFSAAYNPLQEPLLLPVTLEELSLCGCSLSHFPAAEMSTLRIVLFSENNLTEVPPFLLRVNSLVICDLSFNRIAKFPISCGVITGHQLQYKCEVQTVIPNGFVPTPFLSAVGNTEFLGRRSSMEDVCTVDNAHDYDMVSLFDGHGGPHVALFLSRNLPTLMNKEMAVIPRPDDVPAVKSVFKKTQQLCRKMLGPHPEDCLIGSTAVVVLVFADHLVCANAGDSRAVLCTDNEAQRLSFDHKPLEKSEYERIRGLKGFVSEVGRVGNILAVARSFGDFYAGDLVSPDDPYVCSHPISDKDEFLILACDGIWDVVPDDVAVSVVRGSLLQNGDVDLAAHRLRNVAFLRGSTDNISVMVCVLPAFKKLLDQYIKAPDSTADGKGCQTMACHWDAKPKEIAAACAAKSSSTAVCIGGRPQAADGCCEPRAGPRSPHAVRNPHSHPHAAATERRVHHHSPTSSPSPSPSTPSPLGEAHRHGRSRMTSRTRSEDPIVQPTEHKTTTATK